MGLNKTARTDSLSQNSELSEEERLEMTSDAAHPGQETQSAAMTGEDEVVQETKQSYEQILEDREKLSQTVLGLRQEVANLQMKVVRRDMDLRAEREARQRLLRWIQARRQSAERKLLESGSRTGKDDDEALTIFWINQFKNTPMHDPGARHGPEMTSEEQEEFLARGSSAARPNSTPTAVTCRSVASQASRSASQPTNTHWKGTLAFTAPPAQSSVGDRPRLEAAPGLLLRSKSDGSTLTHSESIPTKTDCKRSHHEIPVFTDGHRECASSRQSSLSCSQRLRYFQRTDHKCTGERTQAVIRAGGGRAPTRHFSDPTPDVTSTATFAHGRQSSQQRAIGSAGNHRPQHSSVPQV
ncbi:uncharacterized protein LOC135824575 isoform X2 [Sycon ciliatum]|uniref:uncharacterized protein LOC135824575 isoform X2 n=1 Tax=Sycon ciliatum TaxID=27933 RepID=UPI0031F63F01